MFRATDPGLLFDEDVASFTVSAVNDPPVAIDDYVMISENEPVIINVSANDYDIDNNLDLTSIILIDLPIHGTADVNTNGTVSYFPDQFYHGLDMFNYSIKDKGGVSSNIAMVTISVTDVIIPPVANFDYNPTEPTTDDLIIFTDLSSDSDGYIVNWTWDFGDGTISYDQHPEHEYALGGNYTICLTIIDNEDAFDTYCEYFLISGVDINQSIFDRVFPIRHALDGDGGAAQSSHYTHATLDRVNIYTRRFGMPEFNLTVELRADHPQGTLIVSITFLPEEVPTSWYWLSVNFADTAIDPNTQYFIVCPHAPSSVTTSYGYEWGYAFGNQYDDGSFWFTRDSGSLWRDLPTMYEFVFKTYGFSF